MNIAKADKKKNCQQEDAYGRFKTFCPAGNQIHRLTPIITIYLTVRPGWIIVSYGGSVKSHFAAVRYEAQVIWRIVIC